MVEKPWVGHEKCRNDYPRTERLSLLMAVHYSSGRHTVNYTKIYRCETCDNGVIEKFDSDTWHYHEDEQWDMYWYWQLAGDQLARLEAAIQNCPAPLDSSCECPLHGSLRGGKLPSGATEAARKPARMPYVTFGTHDGVLSLDSSPAS